MARSWAAYVLPAALLVGAVAYFVPTERGDVAAPAPSASVAKPAVSLLGGLREGDVIEGWSVGRVHVNESENHHPQLAIELWKGGSGITVWVGRKEFATKPPVTTERYALTHGDPRPYGEPIAPDAFDVMTAKIAERVRRNEATAPIPDGL